MPAWHNTQVNQYCMCRTQAAAAQFSRGMNSVLNVFDAIKSYADAFQPLFTSGGSTPLTFQEFRQLCSWAYSEPGSNKRKLEEETAYAWEVMLQAIAGIFHKWSLALLIIKHVRPHEPS